MMQAAYELYLEIDQTRNVWESLLCQAWWDTLCTTLLMVIRRSAASTTRISWATILWSVSCLSLIELDRAQ